MAYRDIRLSPSVICMDWLNMRENLDFAVQMNMDSLHYDISDSYFVPSFGLPFQIVKAIQAEYDLPSEYHLMVEEPRRVYDLIPEEENARVSLHYETCRNLHKELVQLRRTGYSPGIIISPTTDLDHVEYIIEEVDSITIMTHNPEFPSEEFIHQIAQKIRELCTWRERVGYTLEIVVDGSVTPDNIPDMAQAGADALILETAALFSVENDIARSYDAVKAAIDAGHSRNESSS